MKRKRGAAKRKPKKVIQAASISVDPGYYSDANKKNDEDDSTKGTNEKEVNAHASSQQLGLDKPVVDNGTVGSAAAKLARAIASDTNSVFDRVPSLHEKIGVKELKSSLQDPIHNKQELDTAQSVIKKIMKMDIAAPFNAPVDPIALRIPDYFDIIDTPMDFGTINSNLEKGIEYKNSKDVFKDVQQIWDNCIKYNKKGSYVLDLMKRVKANFMKQWTAAGLHKEQQANTNGNLPSSPQLVGSSTRDEETPLVIPGGSTLNSSAYMQQQESHFLNQSQHQPFSPWCPPSFNSQHMPYPWPGSYHPGPFPPGYHQHGMPPHYNYVPHQLPDHMNGNSYNQRLNEAGPSLIHSYQPSPCCSHIGPPQYGTWMHQPTSSHAAPSGLQPGINDHTPGHLHVPHRDSTSTLHNNEHASNSVRNVGGHHHQHHPADSVHIHPHHPSASCLPAQQLHSSTHQQAQNPRTEVDRYTGYAGNLLVPPPMQSTVNASKGDLLVLPPTQSTVNASNRGADSPPSPVTDNRSFQPPAHINSTPEQSSTMANMEACHETTADNNFSKSKTQSQGPLECNQHTPLTTNGHESRPRDNNCESQPISQQLWLSRTYYTTKPKNNRVRGPAREPLLREGERLLVTLNEQGQPIGPVALKLTSYLGTLARNGNFLPLPYHEWRAVPVENKENMWQKIQSKFEVDPIGKDWIMRNLGARWKDWKARLKHAHYDTHTTDEERLADCDERVIPEQWAALVAFWSTEKAQKNSARNRVNRAKKKYNHTTGRKSFARIREEEQAKRPDGKELSRAELFVLTRTRKNGEPIDAESSKVITELRNRENGQDTPQEDNKPGDILAEIIGPDPTGRPRCLKLGPSPDDVKPTRVEAIKMVSEAKTEIKEMKDKMAAMEQACSQMASQMAAMVSMVAALQKNAPDKNTPVIEMNASGASDHSPLPQESTRPAPSVGSTRKTRRSTKRLL